MLSVISNHSKNFHNVSTVIKKQVNELSTCKCLVVRHYNTDITPPEREICQGKTARKSCHLWEVEGSFQVIQTMNSFYFRTIITDIY